MVEIIISAVVGAITVALVFGSSFGIKALKKRGLSKKTNLGLEELKTEAIIKAIKVIAKSSGTDYSAEVRALDEFEVDSETFKQLKINEFASKGKVANSKLLKKASKVKL